MAMISNFQYFTQAYVFASLTDAASGAGAGGGPNNSMLFYCLYCFAAKPQGVSAEWRHIYGGGGNFASKSVSMKEKCSCVYQNGMALMRKGKWLDF